MVFHILWRDFLFTHLSFLFNLQKITHSLNFLFPHSFILIFALIQTGVAPLIRPQLQCHPPNPNTV